MSQRSDTTIRPTKARQLVSAANQINFQLWQGVLMEKFNNYCKIVKLLKCNQTCKEQRKKTKCILTN